MRAHGRPIRWLLAFSFTLGLPGAPAPASADETLGKIGQKAQQGIKIVDAVRPMTIEEEKKLGEEVGRRLKSHNGVLADDRIQRYVNFVGLAVARHVPAREGIGYRFIVLDTEEIVNAYSLPGGDIYITKGLLKAVSSEAQLAGVLGHELHHSASRHAVKAIEKDKRWGAVGEASLANRPELLKQVTDAATSAVWAGYGRSEEDESDLEGLDAASGTGYDPPGLAEFLATLGAESEKKKGRGGLFGSHPEIDSRIERVRQRIRGEGLGTGARLPDRYAASVPFHAPDRSLEELLPAAGEVESGGPQSADAKGELKEGEGGKDKGGRKKFGLSALKNIGGKIAGLGHRGSSVVAASDDRSATGGVRGVDPVEIGDGSVAYQDPVINITQAELEAFLHEGELR